MNIYLEKVKEKNKDILFRLLEYSLFEESLYDKNEMNEEAIFEYKHFDKYFTDENYDAFFIRENQTNKLLGFVMMNTYIEKVGTGHSIVEFMVIPKYRRNKIGKQVAFKCFDNYRGNWKVLPSFGSNIAYNFWKKVIDEYTDYNNKYVDGIFIFNNFKHNSDNITNK